MTLRRTGLTLLALTFAASIFAGEGEKAKRNPLLLLLKKHKAKQKPKGAEAPEAPVILKRPDEARGPEDAKPDSDKPDPKLERVLDEMEKRRETLKRIESKLTKTRLRPMITPVPDIYAGRMMFETPRLLFMELKGPLKQKPEDQRTTRTIVTKDFAYIWRVEDKEAERFKLPKLDEKKVSERNPLEYGLAASIRNLKRDYFVTLLGEEEVDGRKTFKVRARPRPTLKDPPYVKIVFWVGEGLWIPVRFQQVKSDGEIVDTYTLRDVEINPVWIFTAPFKPPPSSVGLIQHDLAERRKPSPKPEKPATK